MPVGFNSRKQLKSLKFPMPRLRYGKQSYSKWIFHTLPPGTLMDFFTLANQMYNCITCHLNGLNCWVPRVWRGWKTASFFGHPNFPDTPEIWPRELTLPKTNRVFSPLEISQAPKRNGSQVFQASILFSCGATNVRFREAFISEWNRGISPKQADFSYWSRMEIELNIIYIYIILIPPKKENSI